MAWALLSSGLGMYSCQLCSKAEKWAKFLVHEHRFYTWALHLQGCASWLMWSVKVHDISRCACVSV